MVLWRSGLARTAGVVTMFAVLVAGILHYMRHGPLEVARGDRRRISHDSTNGDLILRHPVGERITHWAVAIVFIFLFLSGLAMFHPFFFWISLALRRRVSSCASSTRIAGAALVLLFYPYAVQVWSDNRWLPADNAWVKNMCAYMRKEHHAEDTGKYNAGQKLMFWSMVPHHRRPVPHRHRALAAVVRPVLLGRRAARGGAHARDLRLRHVRGHRRALVRSLLDARIGP